MIILAIVALVFCALWFYTGNILIAGCAASVALALSVLGYRIYRHVFKGPKQAILRGGQGDSSALGLADGSCISPVGDIRVYLVKNETRHWIESESVLGLLGKTRTQVLRLPEEAVFALPEGTRINEHNIGKFVAGKA